MTLSRTPVQSTHRKAFPKAKRETLIARQGGLCAVCGETLTGPSETDHTIPLFFAGTNDAGNLQVLCVPCHRSKTKVDVAAIAKAKRREKKAASGPREPSRLQSRGFDKRYTRHFNGTVKERA